MKKGLFIFVLFLISLLLCYIIYAFIVLKPEKSNEQVEELNKARYTREIRDNDNKYFDDQIDSLTSDHITTVFPNATKK